MAADPEDTKKPIAAGQEIALGRRRDRATQAPCRARGSLPNVRHAPAEQAAGFDAVRQPSRRGRTHDMSPKPREGSRTPSSTAGAKPAPRRDWFDLRSPYVVPLLLLVLS